MKRTNKTTEVKSTDFANTIYRIRIERNLTQKELGDLIGVSDRTISKWENGTTVPDLETIKTLCKELGTSPGAIIKSEKNFKDILHDFRRMLGNFLNYVLKNIFLITFVVTFILLLLYFINNYNTIKIYNLTYEGDNISFSNGHFIKTKVLNIITINEIKINKVDYDIASANVELYTYLNGDKHVIYENDKIDNIYIEESKSYTDLLTKDVIENIKNNLYIKIDTTDTNDKSYSYESKLILKQKLNNNKLCYKEYIKEQNKNINDLGLQNPFLVPMTTEFESTNRTTPVVLNEENKLASLGFTYDKETQTYTKIDSDGGIIEYCYKMKRLIKELKDDNEKIELKYLPNLKRVSYKKISKNNRCMINVKYFVDNNNRKCIIGDCKNYEKEIDYILSVYKEITGIL